MTVKEFRKLDIGHRVRFLPGPHHLPVGTVAEVVAKWTDPGCDLLLVFFDDQSREFETKVTEDFAPWLERVKE
jgi:hypothetical protein